ncbi:MAG: recombinase family protein [Fusobacteriaceae bacterium]|nr:recombinase family protein [Fusobacteriaceae bacterium]
MFEVYKFRKSHLLNLILIIGFYLLVSGLRPFYCPVELRFCVRSHSDIGVRVRPIFAVWKLDRLGRSVKSLIELVSELNSKNIHFKSLTDSIDTSTPSGRFFFHALFGFKSKSSATLTTLSLLLIINCTVESLNS